MSIYYYDNIINKNEFLYGPANATATQYLLLQKIQIGFTFLVLSFWCWLTRVIPDKIQEGRKIVVCVVRASVPQIYDKRGTGSLHLLINANVA